MDIQMPVMDGISATKEIGPTGKYWGNFFKVLWEFPCWWYINWAVTVSSSITTILAPINRSVRWLK
jgi:CheY-like chemotaxis protein